MEIHMTDGAFDRFINFTASMIELYGAEVLKELDVAESDCNDADIRKMVS